MQHGEACPGSSFQSCWPIEGVKHGGGWPLRFLNPLLMPASPSSSAPGRRGCLPVDTVEWVRQQAARLPRVPSLAFVHIPLPQHMLAWERGPVNGTKGEMVGCPGLDTGFFELAR